VTRLPPAALDREERELREYLGAAYQHERLLVYAHQLEREFARCGDEAAFYRSSEAYLYDLTAFAMTATKDPYLRDLTRLCPAPSRVLDYGCGIGSDGLRLLEAGYDVAFADFDNPSTRYLAWRLERRGLSARVYDLDRDEIPAGYDAAFAFDVAEHVEDPFALLGALEARAGLVVVNLLEPAPGESALHRELPVDELLVHVRAQRLRRYRRYHGRSHLVAYRPGPARARVAERWSARAAWCSGRLAGALSRGPRSRGRHGAP
jgi:SAM-dependent methyltransferase